MAGRHLAFVHFVAPASCRHNAAPVILTPRFFWQRISLLECGGLTPLCLSRARSAGRWERAVFGTGAL